MTAAIETSRLRLREWRPDDRAPFAALNADPEVMAYFPAPLSRFESDAMVDRMAAQMAERGWGLWAVEVVEGGALAGMVGLSVPAYATPASPCVEVGWRLARPFWGRGIATEAARAALGFGFDVLGLEEIVSFTAACNDRSRAVMERLGMVWDGTVFAHPRLPAHHWLSAHVLYRLGRSRSAP